MECKYKDKCSIKNRPKNTCPIGTWFLETAKPHYTNEEYEECIELCMNDSWEDQFEHVWDYVAENCLDTEPDPITGQTLIEDK